MSKWLEKTDVKQLMVYMFGVIVVLMCLLYKKDMAFLNTQLTSIASDISTIKVEQKKEAGKFNAKLEKIHFVLASKDNTLEERLRSVETTVASIKGAN